MYADKTMRLMSNADTWSNICDANPHGTIQLPGKRGTEATKVSECTTLCSTAVSSLSSAHRQHASNLQNTSLKLFRAAVG